MVGEVPLQVLYQEHLAEINENVELNLNMRNLNKLIMIKMNRLDVCITVLLLLLISRMLYFIKSFNC